MTCLVKKILEVSQTFSFGSTTISYNIMRVMSSTWKIYDKYSIWKIYQVWTNDWMSESL